MCSHIGNRDKMFRALKQELTGPSPAGQEIDCAQNITFDKNEAYGPWVQMGTGEEILARDHA